jgi:hypothetical protein
MSKNTYWISDPTDGTKALVEDADQRDQWIQVHGWQEADEPTGQEFVWVANENPDLGPARLNWQAAQDPAWAARGWAPGAPAEPVNTALPPEHPAWAAAEKAQKTSAAPEAPAEKPTRKSAASGESKE